MKVETVKEAIKEAKRFIEAAQEFIDAENASSSGKYICSNPKQSGAMRRASMDLTRKLADLRNNR